MSTHPKDIMICTESASLKRVQKRHAERWRTRSAAPSKRSAAGHGMISTAPFLHPRDGGGRPLNRNTLTLAALTAISLQLTACELVKGIFKAGVWVGVLGVLAIVVLALLVLGRLRG